MFSFLNSPLKNNISSISWIAQYLPKTHYLRYLLLISMFFICVKRQLFYNLHIRIALKTQLECLLHIAEILVRNKQ